MSSPTPIITKPPPSQPARIAHSDAGVEIRGHDDELIATFHRLEDAEAYLRLVSGCNGED